MSRKQSSQLRTVLNSELAEAERQAANQLAEFLGISYSNLSRKLLKREYQRQKGLFENYDSRLFAPLIGNLEGGVNARGFRGTPPKKGAEDE